MTLQEQTTIRCKAQLGLASEEELVELVKETFDAEEQERRWAEFDVQRCFTCGCVGGEHATWCGEQ